MSCISAHDPQLLRLADAIAQRVGQQRFNVWFNNSTRLDLKSDGLEIAVPNDFISEWICTHFTRSIQDAAHEVLGCTLAVRYSVVPQIFETKGAPTAEQIAADEADARKREGRLSATAPAASLQLTRSRAASAHGSRGNAPVLAAAVAAAASGRDVRRPGVPALSEGVSSKRFAALAAGATINALRMSGNTTASNGRASDSASVSQPLSMVGATAGNAPAFGMVAAAIPATTMPSISSRMNPATSAYSGGANSGSGAFGLSAFNARPRLRHDIETFVVGASNQLAYNAALYVSEFPGSQYNPLFIHGNCGLGKTHLLQALCKQFIKHHPTKRWMYLTGEEFTNEFLTALRGNKLDTFRRKVRDLDLLVIDDVHFLGGKKATQEEFLHTFNAIEAMGKQVVMASDNYPKMIAEFGESLINRFVSGMVVRVDPPNFATRCEILRAMSQRNGLNLSEDVVVWVARRVTQNVRELEGAITRINAHTRLSGRPADVTMAQEALGDLDRQLVAPVKPDAVLQSVCNYFQIDHKELMSGRRQRTISLARSVAMYLVRKTAKLSFPEIGMRMGKRNHSTVISACRRIEKAVASNEPLAWTSAVGEREEEAAELVQRLEEHSRSMN